MAATGRGRAIRRHQAAGRSTSASSAAEMRRRSESGAVAAGVPGAKASRRRARSSERKAMAVAAPSRHASQAERWDSIEARSSSPNSPSRYGSSSRSASLQSNLVLVVAPCVMSSVRRYEMPRCRFQLPRSMLSSRMVPSSPLACNTPEAVGVFRELLLEEPASPEQATHHRADRDVEDVGDLLVGEVLQVGEDHRQPEVDGHRVDGPQHVVGEQPVEEGALRVLGDVGRVPGDEPVLHRVALVLDDVALLRRPAVPVDEGVREDLVEPGLDVGPALELVEEAEGPEDRVLDQVLGVAGVLGQPQGGCVEAVEVRQRQRLELPTARLDGSVDRQVVGSSLRGLPIFLPPR